MEQQTAGPPPQRPREPARAVKSVETAIVKVELSLTPYSALGEFAPT
jgi:hypothetical protein